MNQYPSFKAQYGREPVAGKDYDPDDVMCQDDYEYFSGTGKYSNEPSVATVDERRAIRREAINDLIHKYNSGDWVVGGEFRQNVRAIEVTRFGYPMQVYTPFDGFDYGGGVDDPRY